MTKNNNLNRGFSLLELLIVIGIFGLISTVVWAFAANVFKQSTIFRTDLAVNDEARFGIKKFVQEARIMSPSSLGAYPILLASTTAFTFYSDVDHDSLKERYRYFTESGSLKKGVIKPTGSPLVYNSADEKKITVVNNLFSTSTTLFKYFDTNNTQMTYPINITAIRSVEISLPIKLDPRQGTSSITFTSRVTMRTLKDNY